jgi:hypothetical protein
MSQQDGGTYLQVPYQCEKCIRGTYKPVLQEVQPRYETTYDVTVQTHDPLCAYTSGIPHTVKTRVYVAQTFKKHAGPLSIVFRVLKP